MAKNLEQSLKASNPSSCFFIWGAKRQVKRQELNAEHQRWVLSQIQNLRAINNELVNLKAEVFLSYEMIDNLIDGYRAEAERKAELALETHLTAVYEQQKTREKLTLGKRREEAEVILLEQKAQLIKFIMDSVSLDDLKPHHKTLLVQAMLNPQGNQYMDIETLEEIKQYAINEAEAKARFSTATARMKEADAKTAEKTAEQTENDFNEIRNSSKTK